LLANLRDGTLGASAIAATQIGAESTDPGLHPGTTTG
jgi:hypothetical protein